MGINGLSGSGFSLYNGLSKNNGLSVGGALSTGGSGGVFIPSDLGSDLLAWYDASDAATITSTGANLTAIADKSTNARNLTGTNNPQWDGTKITTNGTSNYLSRTSAFMYANGSCEVHIVAACNGGSGLSLLGEGLSSSANPIYQPIRSHFANANDDVYGFVRNTDNSVALANTNSTGASFFDNTKKLVSWIDTGSLVTVLINGVAGSSPLSYTRGTATFDRFCIGALIRSTIGSYIAADYYEIIITKILSDANRNKLMQYLANHNGI